MAKIVSTIEAMNGVKSSVQKHMIFNDPLRYNNKDIGKNLKSALAPLKK